MQGGFSISYLWYPHSPILPQMAVGANSVRPSLFAHMVCTNSNLENPRKRDVEGAVPYIWRYSLSAAKSLSLFADFTSYKRTQKSGAEFSLRHHFVLSFSLFFFYCLSAPLSRLAPIEALPQTPQWALPLDPTSPLASGLSLRFISRFARCYLGFVFLLLFFSIKPTFPIMGIYHSNRLQKRIYYDASHELHSTLFQV